MGLPFQLKIFVSQYLKRFSWKTPELRLLILCCISIQAFLTFLISYGLKLKSLTTLFILGFIINFFCSLANLLLFQFKIEHLKNLGHQQVTLLTKLGSKSTLSLLSIFLIALAYSYSFTFTYQISSIITLSICFIYYLKNKNTLQYSWHRAFQSSSKDNKPLISTALKSFHHAFKEIPKETLFAYLTINSGSLCLSGWLLIYLKELAPGSEILIQRKLLSIIGYLFGFLGIYFFQKLQKKNDFKKSLILSSIFYTLILASLTQIPPNHILLTQLLFFLKDVFNAFILSLKYSWLTSLCSNKSSSLKVYSTLMTLNNLLYFFCSGIGGWMMGHFGWQCLWLMALSMNLIGLFFLIIHSDNSLKDKLSENSSFST